MCSSLIHYFYCWKVTNFNTFLMLFSCLKESNHSHLPLRYKLRPRSDTNQLSNLVCFSPHSFSYNHTCLNLVVKTPSFTHFRVLDSWTLCPGNTCLPSSLARLPLSVKVWPRELQSCHDGPMWVFHKSHRPADFLSPHKLDKTCSGSLFFFSDVFRAVLGVWVYICDKKFTSNFTRLTVSL